MKKLSLLALAAAGLLMVGCSEKDSDLVVDNTPQNLEEFENGGYIGISLSLPSAEGNITRGNDDLSNGIKDEFAVKNATLYIFKGTSEANAVYVDYVSLGTKYNPDTQGEKTPDVWGVQDGVGTKPVDNTDAATEPDEGETNITSTSLNEATKISNELAAAIRADNNSYFAYVVINHNNQMPNLISALDDGTNATTFATFSREKFAKIGADVALEQNILEDGMFMSNAPICNVSGGAAAPSSPTYSTLVPLDKSKIFDNATQAKQEPAACVYVERAAAKITVEGGSSVTSSKIDGYDVNIDGWKVINTEEKFYNTRQINYKSTEEVETGGDAWGNTTAWAAEDWGGYINEAATPTAAKYRFVSYYQFLPTLPSGLTPQTGQTTYQHTTGFRTYFAADPHYSKDAVNSGVSALKFTTADDDRPWIELGKHAYTTENTFDVKHQTWQNTTMVTVKVKLTKNNANPNFYTVGKGSQTMYISEDDVKAVIHNIVTSDAEVGAAAQNLLTLISKNNTDKTVQAGLTVAFTTPSNSTTGVAFTVTPAYTISDGVTPSDADYTGGKDASITDTSSPLYNKTEADLKKALEIAIYKVLYSDFNETDFNALAATDTKTLAQVQAEYFANLEYDKTVLLSYYKGGEMYYNVKIQHFGEAETPWGGNDVVANGSGVNVNEIYFNTLYNATPDADKITAGQNKFLGRYGVVRDNWYKLTIDKVTKIGSATPEDPSKITPDTPDDEIENYISVHVHIVPWVLRSQTVNL